MGRPAKDVGLRWWQRFHVRLTLFHGGVVFLVLTAMAIVFYQVGSAAELEGLQGRLRATVTTLSLQLDVDALAGLSPDGAPADPRIISLAKLFHELAEADPDISSIYALRRTGEHGHLRFIVDYATDGQSATPGQAYDAADLPRMLEGLERVVVESSLYRDEFGLSLSGYAPLRRQSGESLGLVGVDVMADRVEAMNDRVMDTTLMLYGLAALLLAGLAVLTGRQIRGALGEINAAAQRIAEGDFEVELQIDRKDEFGLMGQHFNTISQSLKERDFIRDIFGRYVSADVARRILTDRSAQALGGELREATILFSDLEGYSTMNEQVPPADMLAILNAYLAAMTEIIDVYQGVIIEFLGDAILCVFNTPNDVHSHAQAGVRCALEMRTKLEELNEEWVTTPVAASWRAAGFDRLRARIGIHTGVVVAGNIGSRTRMKYGVLGDVVNVASRLEQLNKSLGTTILVSETTANRLLEPLRSQATQRGEQELKGRTGRIEVFAL